MSKQKISIGDFSKTESQGWIINRSIEIEKLMDSIMLAYFNPENAGNFLQVVLHSSVMHYGGKVKVLIVIGIDKSMSEDLRSIGRIRNSFAHTNISGKMPITKTHDKLETNSEEVLRVMNANGELKAIPFKKLMQEFLLIYKRVEPKLKELIKNLSN